MSILNVQQLLAQLYTDEKTLAEFLADRRAFCKGLSDTEASFIEQIDGKQLEFFARSLRRKRASEAKKFLTMTASALGERFDEEFYRYSATCIPGGVGKPMTDAMAFCEYLVANNQTTDPPLSEIARYEFLRHSLLFKLTREKGPPVVCRTRLRKWPIFRLARFAYNLPALDGCYEIRENLRERSTLVLFARVPGRLYGIWYW